MSVCQRNNGHSNCPCCAYSTEETRFFMNFINSTFEIGDKLIAHHLPIVSELDLFKVLNDGLILMRLINKIKPNMIEETRFHSKINMNIFQKHENLAKCIASAKALKCRLVNIDGDDIVKGRPVIVLSLLWQLVRLIINDKVSKSQKNDIIFKTKGHAVSNNIAVKLKQTLEQTLLKWVNLFLRDSLVVGRSQFIRVIKNFDKDFENPLIFCKLLNKVNPLLCSDILKLHDLSLTKNGCSIDSITKREISENVLYNAKRLGIKVLIESKDLISGNEKLIISFLAQIYEAQYNPIIDIPLPPQIESNIQSVNHQQFLSKQSADIISDINDTIITKGEQSNDIQCIGHNEPRRCSQLLCQQSSSPPSHHNVTNMQHEMNYLSFKFSDDDSNSNLLSEGSEYDSDYCNSSDLDDKFSNQSFCTRTTDGMTDYSSSSSFENSFNSNNISYHNNLSYDQEVNQDAMDSSNHSQSHSNWYHNLNNKLPLWALPFPDTHTQKLFPMVDGSVMSNKSQSSMMKIYRGLP